VDRTEVLRRRLATQRIAGPGADRGIDVVRLLTCVQSQEHAHGFWSLGLRTTGRTMAQVRAEFDAGTFVRTHILRPTWHYVAAEDLGWILAVTSPRVHQLNDTVRRRLGMERTQVERSTRTIVAELADGHHLTRAELGKIIGVEGTALAYHVMHAELEYLICSGPMRGAQHTYALVSERIHTERTGTLADLARRFFVGHGPAGVADFRRWASLTQTQAAEATAEASRHLQAVEVEGSELWFDPEAPGPALTTAPSAALLPLYDEALLSYPRLNFPLAAGHPHRPGADLFVGSVVVDTTNVGTWRRTLAGRRLVLELDLAPGLTGPQRAAIEDAARRLGHFLEREVQLANT
jgi:hypothetical protein